MRVASAASGRAMLVWSSDMLLGFAKHAECNVLLEYFFGSKEISEVNVYLVDAVCYDFL